MARCAAAWRLSRWSLYWTAHQMAAMSLCRNSRWLQTTRCRHMTVRAASAGGPFHLMCPRWACTAGPHTMASTTWTRRRSCQRPSGLGQATCPPPLTPPPSPTTITTTPARRDLPASCLVCWILARRCWWASWVPACTPCPQTTWCWMMKPAGLLWPAWQAAAVALGPVERVRHRLLLQGAQVAAKSVSVARLLMMMTSPLHWQCCSRGSRASC
mmetsp:Transcript_331/g.672  ORF Transcript_331/g.672 Transcript_331/m.672 type:complete len:214 (-) Transcript_331:833-1474(-)